MCNILGGLIFNFAIEILTRSSPRFGKVFNGIGVDGVGVNFLFFCISLSCLHFACVFALFFFFVFVFCLFSFFRLSSFFFFLVFLCFFVSLFVSRDFSVFCTFRLSLSLRLRGNCKNPKKKREFRSDPVYTNSVRNFPSDAPFSRLRPNDPSSGLTNDRREDPITANHRPIAHKNSPKIFCCNVSAQYSIINYFRIF